MSTLPRPFARSLIVCDRVVNDPNNSNRVSLIGVVSTIRTLSRPAFPAIRPLLSVFAQLTECRGAGLLWVEVRQADTDRVLFRTRIRTVTFPSDPLAVHGVVFRLVNLVFPTAGLYWVQLWFDMEILAQHPLKVI